MPSGVPTPFLQPLEEQFQKGFTPIKSYESNVVQSYGRTFASAKVDLPPATTPLYSTSAAVIGGNKERPVNGLRSGSLADSEFASFVRPNPTSPWRTFRAY